MAASDRWLHGGPLGILSGSDDAGTQKWWIRGEPDPLLGSSGGGPQTYDYTGTTPIQIGIVSTHSRTICRTITTPIAIGVPSTYSYQPYTELQVAQLAVETLSSGTPPIRIAQFIAETLSVHVVELDIAQFVVETLSRVVYDPCDEPPVGEDLATAVGPLLFVKWLPGDGTTRAYAEQDLPDPETWQAGLKAGRLLSVSTLRRALAGPSFDYEVGRFEITVADPDRTLRTLLSATPTKYWTERYVGVYMVSDVGRRGQVEPRLIGYGLVEDAPSFSGLTVKLRVKDFIGSRLWTRGD